MKLKSDAGVNSLVDRRLIGGQYEAPWNALQAAWITRRTSSSSGRRLASLG